MGAVKEIEALKNRVAKLTRDKERAEARYEYAMQDLLEQFGVKSLKEARKKLKELEKEETEAGEAYETALQEFKVKWKDLQERLEESS